MTTSRDVSLVVLADRPDHLRVLLAALRVQTCVTWELIVLDQSGARDIETIVARFDSEISDGYGSGRVHHSAVLRRGDWGQAEKMAAVDRASGTFVGFPNDDAYYCPVFLEAMLEAAKLHQADLVYCDWVSASDMGRHRYVAYEGVPVTGRIDVGGFLVKRSVIQANGWPDRGPTGDGHLVESLVRQGVRHVRVPRLLYVKN